ncbi:MAG: TonB-dependent receptor [Gammaproteobacteria bacterium]|nr:TonB-dependent receptor [Gammaproteobacteria bacterium]
MREKYQPSALTRAVSLGLATTFTCVPVLAQDQDSDTPETMDAIEVIGVTPTLGVGLPESKIPYNVQSASSEDLQKGTSLDITDYMNRNFGSVIVNDAQNNPLQPDIQYRGFTASPLLGLPQGLAVYQNGVRVNEVFGDTINWDLIPESSIANMNLIGGANPLFGLNTLGGAINLETKTGFSHPGHSLEVYGGSFDRIVSTIESGGNNGTLGYYTTIQYFDENGWRDASPSTAKNIFTALSYRDGTTTSLDLNFNYGNTDMIGNGAIPIELAARDREAIFTSPDQTENEMIFFDLQGEHWLNDLTQLAGNVFYRDNDTTSFNGDGTEFEECDVAGIGEVLLEVEDEDDFEDNAACDGTENQATIEGFGAELIEDQNGNFILAENAQGSERNGLNNRSLRDQKNWGGNLQTTYLGDLFGRDNQVIVGGGYNYGEVDFNSSQEIARLNALRSTVGSGLFVPEEGTRVNSDTESWSLYITDTLSITDKLDLTLSGRYNHTNVTLQDLGATDPLAGENPELNGDHDFDRFNPAAGVTYAFQPNLSGYFSYSESSRAPTAVELACAEPDAPCNLPNGFLADPPLEQVVAKSFEGGFRGNFRQVGFLNNVGWHIGGFHTTNEDDIIFLSTGGVSSNQGFFDNVGDTERVGMELGLTGQLQRLDWFLSYSYVSATFETPFTAASANHPRADDGEIQVRAGDDIPGIPDHTFKFGGDYAVTSRLSVGGDLLYKSGVHLRGDEANLLGKLDGYTTVNIRGSYQVNDRFSIFARVNNLFDEEYESFGLLGEPDEVPGFDNFSDNRFVGVGAPISGFIGFRLQL